MNEFNTIYWFKDPAKDGKNQTVSSGSSRFDISLLSEMSEKWFNVYKTVNTFVWDRRKQEDLAEIRACFVDIDYVELADRGFSEEKNAERGTFLNKKFQDEIYPAILDIRSEYGIFPSEFNITNKGFHILFPYDFECHFITPELHAQINHTIGDILGGDKNARDVSRVYRIAGYADWKGGYHGKIKPLDLKYPEAKITKEIIEERFGLIFEERDPRSIISALESQKAKLKNWNQNRQKILAFDAMDFVKSLEDYFRSALSFKNPPYARENIEKAIRLLSIKKKDRKDNFVFCEEDGVTPTSGLFMELKNWVFSIADYSRKTRIWNLNFLQYWILPALWVVKWDEWKHLNIILNSSIGIGLSSIPERNTPMNSKLLTDYFHGRVRFQNSQSRALGEKNPLKNIISTPSMAKVYLALFSFVYDRITSSSKILWNQDEKGYFIGYSDLFDFAFPESDTASKRKHHKKILSSILTHFSDMEVFFDNGIELEWKKIVSVRFPKLSLHKGQKDGFFLIPLQERSFRFGDSQALFDLRVLSFENSFLETRITDLLLYAGAMTSNGRQNFTLKADYAYEFLGLTGAQKSKENTLRKHFLKAVSVGILGSYSLAGGKIVLSKYKKKATLSKTKK